MSAARRNSSARQATEPLEPTATELTRVQDLPIAMGTWIGGRRAAHLRTADDDPLDICLWLAPHERQVRAMKAVGRNQEPHALAALLIQAVLEPTDPAHPARPTRLGVATDERAALGTMVEKLGASWDEAADPRLIDTFVAAYQEEVNGNRR